MKGTTAVYMRGRILHHVEKELEGTVTTSRTVRDAIIAFVFVMTAAVAFTTSASANQSGINICIGEYESPDKVPPPDTVQGIPTDQYSGSTCADHPGSFFQCSDAHGTPGVQDVINNLCRGRPGTWTQAYPPAAGGHCGFGWYHIECK
jgi:hypothetical protein